MFPTFYIPRGRVFIADVDIDANSSSPDGLSGEWVEFTMDQPFTLIVTAVQSWSFTPSDTVNLELYPLTWIFRFGIRNTGTGVVGDYWHPDAISHPAPYYLTQAAAEAAMGGTSVELSFAAGTYRFFLWDATVDDNRGRGKYRLEARY